MVQFDYSDEHKFESIDSDKNKNKIVNRMP